MTESSSSTRAWHNSGPQMRRWRISSFAWLAPRAPVIRWNGCHDWPRSLGDCLGAVAVNFELSHAFPEAAISSDDRVRARLVWNVDCRCRSTGCSRFRSGEYPTAAHRRSHGIVAAVPVLAVGADFDGQF